MCAQTNKFLTIDRVSDNRFHVFLNTESNTYHCHDENSGETRDLRVRLNSKRSSKFISFTYQENGKRRYYHKTIAKIRWELFREWDKGNRPLVGLSDQDIQDILKNYLNAGGTISTLTRLKHSKSALVRKAHLWIERNGGLEKFYEVTKGLNIEPALYLFDRKQNLLKSSFEFITFAILDHNGIDYEYEPFRVQRFIPDFYIPETNLIIEILGLGTRWEYNAKSQRKVVTYRKEGYDYLPIDVDGKKPFESIYLALLKRYKNLTAPEISDYYQVYAKNYPQYISHLTNLLEILLDRNEGTKRFEKENRSLYNHCIERWGSIYEAVKELVGYPSGLQRPDGYWDSMQNAQYELEMVWKKFQYIPSNTESQKGVAEDYGLRAFYQNFGGDKALQAGGLFGDFIDELKLKYGYFDVQKFQAEQRKNDELALREEHLKILSSVYIEEMRVTGKNSLYERHRSTYNWALKNHSTIFDAIKTEFGYPPPSVRRPGGYYAKSANIEYELRQLWPHWLYVPEYSEVNGESGSKWTWNSLFAAVGREAFIENGVYFNIVTSLKSEFGSRDIAAEQKEAFHSRFMEYLNGVNDGQHLVAGGSKTLGDFQKYADHAVSNFGSVFSAIAVLIGRPNHWVKRPRGYFDSLANCRQEIEWVKSDYERLPKFSECKSRRKDLNGLAGVYQRHKSKAFKENGIFHDLTDGWL